MSIRISNLTCGYKGHAVISGFDAVVEQGSVFCLLGPNGVGKTTLFRTMLGLLPAIGGSVEVDGEETLHCSDKHRAKLLSYVPQAHTPPFAFTAADVVVMGASAVGGMFGRPGASNYDVAQRAMDELGILDLAPRAYTELSGGQRQMVLIARAVAQGSRYLMMDEPCASLDLGNEARVLEAVKNLARKGFGVVMTTHSPAHVAQCEARGVLLMRDGSRVTGGVEELLDPQALSRAYGVDVAVGKAACGQGPDALQTTLCGPVVR